MENFQKVQRELAEKVVQEGELKEIRLIGGMDVSHNLYDPAQMIYAAVVVLSYPELELVHHSEVAMKQEIPYVPGFLGFREAPPLIEAFSRLTCRPDVLFVDGHGVSHPRGLGIASHVGVLLDLPTIGVAKSILVGEPQSALRQKVGSQVPLIYHEKPIATVLRSKKGANPLIVSVGHKISLDQAVMVVKSALRGYRLPEPTRQAHLAANRFRCLHKTIRKFTIL